MLNTRGIDITTPHLIHQLSLALTRLCSIPDSRRTTLGWPASVPWLRRADLAGAGPFGGCRGPLERGLG
jgi:hypothetical protein